LADERAEYEIVLKDKFLGGLKKIDSKFDSFERKVDGFSGNKSKGLGGFASGLGGIAKFAGIAGLAVGAAGLGKSIIQLGTDMEQTRVSFTTFLGDAEKANKVIEDLNNFSNFTPFDNAQVIQAGKGLLAFGTSSEKLIPALKTIGDISAGTGKDFNELATIYGKARVAGTLYAEDINQLVEAGVPIMGEFAKALGTSEDQVKKLASEGKLKFKDLETAFQNLTSEGGLFFNLMEKQSDTVQGKFSTLLGKLQTLGIKIGEMLLPPLAKGLDLLIGIVDFIPKLDFSSIGRTLSDIGKQFAEIWDAVTQLFSSIDLGVGSFITLENVMRGVSIGFRMITMPLRVFMQGLLTVKDIADNIGQTFKGLSDVLIGALTFDSERVKRGIRSSLAATVEGFGEIRNRVNEFAKGEAMFLKDLFTSKDDSEASSSSTATSTSAQTIASTTGQQTPSSKVSNSISGSSPKNVTLNINKLVENITFNSSMQENEQMLIEKIKRALLVSINNGVIAAG